MLPFTTSESGRAPRMPLSSVAALKVPRSGSASLSSRPTPVAWRPA
ncbi:MAG: hypothetical protein IPK12_02395 [Gemmatimonadetes bacterium]|nr:hypothetical protein [Gemmatimonadota bacterium]